MFCLTGEIIAQINQAYCAIASIAALLNSLKYAKCFWEGSIAGWTFDLLVDAAYEPYPYAMQQGILRADCMTKNVMGHQIDDDGQPIYAIRMPSYR